MPVVTGVFTQLPEIVRPGIVDVGILSFLRCRETTETLYWVRRPLSAFRCNQWSRLSTDTRSQTDTTIPTNRSRLYIFRPTFKILCQFGNFRHGVRLGVGLGIVDGVERVVRFVPLFFLRDRFPPLYIFIGISQPQTPL